MLEMRELQKIALAALVSIAVSLISLTIGHYEISLTDIMNLLRGTNVENSESQAYVLMQLRLPRIFAGFAVGGMLAGAGVLTQGLFRNALAAPSVLGMNAGAAFFVAVFFYLGLYASSPFQFALAAVLGSVLVTLLVLMLFTVFKGSIESLIFAGIALNAIFGALTSFVVIFLVEDYQRAPQMIQWLFGGLADKSWAENQWVWPLAIFALCLAMKFVVKLDVLSLGADTAKSLGVVVFSLQVLMMTLVGVAVGLSVALAGGVSFVGLIIPHVSRMLIGPRHLPLLLFSVFNGATLVVGADVLARSLRPSAEIPIGVLTALLGGPFFLLLILQRLKAGSS